jgi:hypothetical protein
MGGATYKGRLIHEKPAHWFRLRDRTTPSSAGCEDVNDAERLCRDPAMRWVVGDRAIEGTAASASQMAASRQSGGSSAYGCPFEGGTKSSNPCSSSGKSENPRSL